MTNKKPFIVLASIFIAALLVSLVVANKLNAPATGNVATSTATSTGQLPEVRSETEARLEARIGQAATGLNLTVVPLEVVEDSRCPVGVSCIQVGTVRIRAKLTSGMGTADQIFVLNQPIATEAEQVALVEVKPEQMAGGQIKSSDYRFIFEVKKRIEPKG